jgi:hypothetical protein
VISYRRHYSNEIFHGIYEEGATFHPSIAGEWQEVIARGEKNVQGDKSWETSILEDFDDLRKNGFRSPPMDEVEKMFAAGG